MSIEKYNQLQGYLYKLITTEWRCVDVEDSLEWDVPLGAMQSIFAQLMKRYIQTEVSNTLYGSDLMKRIILKYLDTIKIDRIVARSSSFSLSDPGNRQVHELLTNIVAAIPPKPPSIKTTGAKEKPSNAPHVQPLQQPQDINKLHCDLQRIITLCPYNVANLYLKLKFPTDSKISVAKFLVNAESLVPEIIPRQNLFHLIGSDFLNSPDIDMMKEHVGKEHESLLEHLLTVRHMEFETEEDSRKKGRQKTPDILFTIPMAVRLPAKYHTASQRRRHHYETNGVNIVERNYYKSGLSHTLHDVGELENFGHARSNRSESFDLLYNPGSKHPVEETLTNPQTSDENPTIMSSFQKLHINSVLSQQRIDSESTDGEPYLIINWIDSKALFADLETFEENIQQFRTYTNRYGRGMVIYWYGFCEDILNHSVLSMNDDILVCDGFPDDWMFPTGEPADGRRPAFDGISLPTPPDKTA